MGKMGRGKNRRVGRARGRKKMEDFSISCFLFKFKFDLNFERVLHKT
jgi:hypothetical protein